MDKGKTLDFWSSFSKRSNFPMSVSKKQFHELDKLQQTEGKREKSIHISFSWHLNWSSTLCLLKLTKTRLCISHKLKQGSKPSLVSLKSSITDQWIDTLNLKQLHHMLTWDVQVCSCKWSLFGCLQVHVIQSQCLPGNVLMMLC